MTMSIGRVLSLRNFRLLFASTAVSLLGSQFTLIAIPWLALQLTGDPIVLGLVLALEGIPRAIFMILGGAFCDRLNPCRMMLITDIASCLLTLGMVFALCTGGMHIGWLYAFALAFGITSGLAIPATNSIIPYLVKESDFEAGNSLIMGVTQLAAFIGPTLAGILIGQLSTSSQPFGIAFALDAASFAISALLLWYVQCDQATKEQQETRDSIFVSIWSGVTYLWTDRPLRSLFLMLTTMNFLLMGPLMVGIPLLADQRLPEGASAFGLLMSAFAGGSLAGCLVAGSLPRPSRAIMNLIIVTFISLFGLVTAALGFLYSTWIDFALLFLIGGGNGYLAVLLFAWMQSRAPKAMLGRLMSLLTFSNAGLLAVSQLIAGLLGSWSLTWLFTLAGGLVLLLPLLFSPSTALTYAEEPLDNTSPGNASDLNMT